MGLDMYLTAKRYIWSGICANGRDNNIAEKIREILPEIGDMRPNYVTVEAIYWRKSNQIHRWFVENVQEGNDDCSNYFVERTQLQELADLCEKVLSDPENLGPALLPIAEGFFFGSDEYGEWYTNDLVWTRDRIVEILANEGLKSDWDFEYHASW